MSDNGIVERIAAMNISKKASAIGNNLVKPGIRPSKPEAAQTFESILNKESKLTFSSHAQERLNQRQISLEPSELIRLEKAVNDAQNKGAKDALILLNRKAFIVSIANKTVITALNSDENESKVYTNIDSAVIA